jgi:protein-S-isoprenylcysteine O-methyltransferase Ste14
MAGQGANSKVELPVRMRLCAWAAGRMAMKGMLAWVDMPPVWLAGHLVLAYLLSQITPSMFGQFGDWTGIALVGGGFTVMVLAVSQMTLKRTTVIPRRDPSSLVTGGVFSLSRNPIYLADAMILTGAILWWDAAMALPLVASFVSVIQARFIKDEEARLTAAFGPEFDLWAAKVRRWIGRH